MDDKEIISLIEDYETNSYGVNDSELSHERAEALDYFLGRPFGNEIDGRSQVVSHDAKDTVLWVLPALMKVFTAGDEIVRFDPKAQGDTEAAEQETAYINHLVTEKNRGFEVFYNWFFDALVSKSGYVKAYWDTYEDVKRETYQGISDEEMALILQDKDIKPIAHSQYADVMGNVYHDLQIEVMDTFGKVCIENVAPEDMMVSYGVTGTSLEDADFVEQRSMQTISQLREMGFDVDDNISSFDASWDNEETESRDLYGEDDFEGTGASRRVLVKEVYIRLDRNDDGIAELWRFVIVGNTILDQGEAEVIPYASLCPVPMPHRHVGLSFVDLVKDLQLIKSTLLRNALDAQYQSINGRFAISDRVNLDDMLISRPGGVVRVDGDPAGSIMPLTNPVDGTRNLTMIEYVDQIRQTRTGVTDSYQGMDVNALNKTKGGTQMLMSAAQSRVELVARIFAETGVKDLFMLVHQLVRKHANKEEIFKLRNKWVPVDPRTWESRKDMTVSVGLGTGNKDQQLQHLMMILQAQKEALQIGLATPKNIYNSLVQLTQNAGFKESEQFWTDPEGMERQPQQPPQPSPDAVLKAETDKQIAMMRTQAEMQKQQVDSQQIGQEMQAELYKRQQEQELRERELQMQAELERYKAELNAQTQIQIAQIKAEMDAKSIVDKANIETTANSNAALMSAIQNLQAQQEKMVQAMLQQAMEGSRIVSIKKIKDPKTGRLIGGVQVRADGSETPINIQ